MMRARPPYDTEPNDPGFLLIRALHLDCTTIIIIMHKYHLKIIFETEILANGTFFLTY